MNTSLALPAFDYSALDRADLAAGTRRHYKAAIALLLAAQIDPFDYSALANYAFSLPSSGRSNLKAALAIITRDYVNRAKAGASLHNHEAVQAFLWKVEAMNAAITVSQPDAERQPHWLSQDQVNNLLALTRSSRDYIVLAVLLGAGLRREELENLTFGALAKIPYNGKLCETLAVRGKGDKTRTVPISALLASRIRAWQAETHSAPEDRVARRISKAGKPGESLSAYGIFRIVRKYGLLLGIPDLDPHDCRRSYGRLLYEATHDIMLVKDVLGHQSVATTQIYIGLQLRLGLPENAFPVG